MESIEKAAGQIAGFGVKLWPVIQDLTQLQRDYREAWETFMGNAGLLTFFGNTDLTTTEHIAKGSAKSRSFAACKTSRKTGSAPKARASPICSARSQVLGRAR